MSMKLSRWFAPLAAAALSAGCVVTPVGGYYPADGPVVGVAPPPPQGEVVGVAPAAGMIWIGGYWGWGGGRYVWHPGHWTHARPGHHWVPHAWAPARGGWVHRPGHWSRGDAPPPSGRRAPG